MSQHAVERTIGKLAMDEGIRLLGAAFCAMALLVAGCGRPQTHAAAPPPEVEVAAVEQRDVPIVREWVATLDGYVNAQVQPRVTQQSHAPSEVSSIAR